MKIRKQYHFSTVSIHVRPEMRFGLRRRNCGIFICCCPALLQRLWRGSALCQTAIETGCNNINSAFITRPVAEFCGMPCRSVPLIAGWRGGTRVTSFVVCYEVMRNFWWQFRGFELRVRYGRLVSAFLYAVTWYLPSVTPGQLAKAPVVWFYS